MSGRLGSPLLAFVSLIFLTVTLEYHISVALSNIKMYNLDLLLEINKRSLTFLVISRFLK